MMPMSLGVTVVVSPDGYLDVSMTELESSPRRDLQRGKSGGRGKLRDALRAAWMRCRDPRCGKSTKQMMWIAMIEDEIKYGWRLIIDALPG